MSEPEAPVPSPTLSKNQQKKLLKAESRKAFFASKKLLEKQRKKDKKRAFTAEIEKLKSTGFEHEATRLIEESRSNRPGDGLGRKSRQESKARLEYAKNNPTPTIVIDNSFTHLMSRKEMSMDVFVLIGKGSFLGGTN